MSEKGCLGHIVGGAIKGALMGGAIGALAGVALRQNSQTIIIMATDGAKFLGPDSWKEIYPQCGWDQQSPINIRMENLQRKKTMKPLKWINYSNTPGKMVLENSKHSIHAKGVWKSRNDMPCIKDGPLVNRYYFSQLHFHWGTDDFSGSEHLVDGFSYPLEMHVVHDRDPAEVDEDSPGLLVVVSFMFEIVQRDNPVFNNILEGAKVVQGNVKKRTYIKPFPLTDLFRTFNGEYVTYKGSLTTPPCTENIVWIMASKTFGISRKQLAALRNSVTDEWGNAFSNDRPVQKLNSRNVYFVY